MTDPVVLIGNSGKIIHSNAAAARLFEAGDGISAGDDGLRFVDAAAERAFIDGFHACRAGERVETMCAFVVPRPSGNRPYIVTMRPLPAIDTDDRTGVSHTAVATLLVAIRDPEDFGGINADLLAQSYDLSPAEIDLAVSMHAGATIKDVAGRRGVAITTVRTQLYALMGKMYVHRQIDLIRLLQQYRSPF